MAEELEQNTPGLQILSDLVALRIHNESFEYRALREHETEVSWSVTRVNNVRQGMGMTTLASNRIIGFLTLGRSIAATQNLIKYRDVAGLLGGGRVDWSSCR